MYSEPAIKCYLEVWSAVTGKRNLMSVNYDYRVELEKMFQRMVILGNFVKSLLTSLRNRPMSKETQFWEKMRPVSNCKRLRQRCTKMFWDSFISLAADMLTSISNVQDATKSFFHCFIHSLKNQRSRMKFLFKSIKTGEVNMELLMRKLGQGC